MPSVSTEQAKAEALARFQDPSPNRINCYQALLCFALLRMGEDPSFVTDARYMGGGVAGMGELCGVLNCIALICGIRDHTLMKRGLREPPSAADALKQNIRDFEAEFGARRCRELTGYDLSSPEGMDAFRKSDIRARCSDYLNWAFDRLDPLLAPAVETV
jgi:hypothetical protein